MCFLILFITEQIHRKRKMLATNRGAPSRPFRIFGKHNKIQVKKRTSPDQDDQRAHNRHAEDAVQGY